MKIISFLIKLFTKRKKEVELQDDITAEVHTDEEIPIEIKNEIVLTDEFLKLKNMIMFFKYICKNEYEYFENIIIEQEKKYNKALKLHEEEKLKTLRFEINPNQDIFYFITIEEIKEDIQKFIKDVYPYKVLKFRLPKFNEKLDILYKTVCRTNNYKRSIDKLINESEKKLKEIVSEVSIDLLKKNIEIYNLFLKSQYLVFKLKEIYKQNGDYSIFEDTLEYIHIINEDLKNTNEMIENLRQDNYKLQKEKIIKLASYNYGKCDVIFQKDFWTDLLSLQKELHIIKKGRK